MKLFGFFEIFLGKCDTEDNQVIIIADMNCYMIKTSNDSGTNKLTFLSKLYNLEQPFEEPTRVSSTSSTLIDLIYTNQPNNISYNGMIYIGMCDHSLIYAVKISIPNDNQTRSNIGNLKRFNDSDFIQNLSRKP